jgi:valyl-tRNA synthetase
MEAKYSPIQIEEKWSKVWADRELVRPGSEDHFSQIIPPPNVTGTLHIENYGPYAKYP